ncbi:MAG: hypothetical protein U0271_47300 [Polyangiaceae bacterium]
MVASTRRVRTRDALLFGLFVVAWLLPIAWVGGTNRDVPLVGHYLNNQYRVGCLFTKAPAYWDSFHVLYKTSEDGEWIEHLDDAELSTMHPFGHASRFDMLVGRSTITSRGLLQRQQLAEFVRDRIGALHPDVPPIVAIRFVQAYDFTNSYDFPKGAWEKKRLDAYPLSRQADLSTHFFDGRRPIEGAKQVVAESRWEAMHACKK